MSSSFCSNCSIELQNDDTIRDHYKSEFHRYNIKRKLVGLPPVSEDQFSKKKAQLIADSSQSDRDQVLKCEPCGKTFASKATYKQHLESKRHRDNLKEFNRRGRGSVRDREERKENRSSKKTNEDPTVCLFCNQQNADIDENLVHMRLAHSFFISEANYLKDLSGLLKRLGEKIQTDLVCLHCGSDFNKEGGSGESVQRHMIDKGHIFMNTDDFQEYTKFYDFNRVVDDLKKKNLVLGDDVVAEEDEYLEMDMGSESEDDEHDHGDAEWEVIDGQTEGVQAGAIGANDKKIRVKRAKLLESGEIQLPNGQILGHRRYKHIYRQYYRESVRQAQAEDNYLEYADEKVLAARQEETRLAALQNEIKRKERVRVEAQVNKIYQKREKDSLKLAMRTNITQQYLRKQEN